MLQPEHVVVRVVWQLHHSHAVPVRQHGLVQEQGLVRKVEDAITLTIVQEAAAAPACEGREVSELLQSSRHSKAPHAPLARAWDVVHGDVHCGGGAGQC